jgi:hypothetical protein
MPDSILIAYKKGATPRLKSAALFEYIFEPGITDSESFKRSVDLSAWLKKENDEASADYIDLNIAGVATFKGDFSTGLSLALPALSHFEKHKDQFGIMRATNIIGTSYAFARDFDQAFLYYKKSIRVAEVIESRGFLSVAYNDIGVAYSLANMPDSGLLYEYLRLSYHGIRARDKSFNATLKTDFDETIGNINIIQQDIGRVLLNLFNNAFYAVNEKKKNADENYKPRVSVQTKKTNDKIEIRVIDNGNGVPRKLLDKIFQPFFTTKPTGQGTGLGLSLAYDIVKAHGGELKVHFNAEEGTIFTIELPITV